MADYTSINPDLLAWIPANARHVLEVGCGAGSLAKAFHARQPAARYVGVEISEAAAREADLSLDQLVHGDIEQPEVWAALDQARQGQGFDTLILDGVLERLRDPWQVLSTLRTQMADGGLCVACIPNVAHWSIVLQQLKGRWDYADAGPLDRTHLRFFTLDSAIELFRNAGWTFLDARPRIWAKEKTEGAIKEFAPVAEALGIEPNKLRRDLSAFQWVIRALNGPTSPRVHLVGLGLKKVAGVTEARVDYPLATLNTLPMTRTVWDAGSVKIPRDFEPGVFILHRRFMNDPTFNDAIEAQIAKGWTIVSDIDDDPHHWEGYVTSDFHAFRGVHAVTVSTEPLAAIIREWNPNVQVFPNAIFQLPRLSPTTPKQGDRLRIFFGALNRGQDWIAVEEGIVAAAAALGEAVELVIVHEREIHDNLPTGIKKEFHPVLPHDHYMELLSSCDIALLPMENTRFNQLKSDLKFIECCAAGVVPICSPVVYSERPEHREIGMFATSAEEWRIALESLCRSPEDIAHRRALGVAYVKRERMHSHQADARETYYRGLVLDRESLENQRRHRLEGRRLPIVSEN